jgi:signal transduction histidine kinase
MKLRDTDTVHEQAVIQRQVDHLVRLVDDLLDVSRIASGKVELRKETVSLADVLNKAIEMASPLLSRSSTACWSMCRPCAGMAIRAAGASGVQPAEQRGALRPRAVTSRWPRASRATRADPGDRRRQRHCLDAVAAF